MSNRVDRINWLVGCEFGVSFLVLKLGNGNGEGRRGWCSIARINGCSSTILSIEEPQECEIDTSGKQSA